MKLKGSSVLDFSQQKMASDSQTESDTESTRVGDENGSQFSSECSAKHEHATRAHLDN